MNNRPCLNCKDRYPGCHSKCQKEDYLKERAKRYLIYEARGRERGGKRCTAHWIHKGTRRNQEE